MEKEHELCDESSRNQWSEISIWLSRKIAPAIPNDTVDAVRRTSSLRVFNLQHPARSTTPSKQKKSTTSESSVNIESMEKPKKSKTSKKNKISKPCKSNKKRKNSKKSKNTMDSLLPAMSQQRKRRQDKVGFQTFQVCFQN